MPYYEVYDWIISTVIKQTKLPDLMLIIKLVYW